MRLPLLLFILAIGACAQMPVPKNPVEKRIIATLEQMRASGGVYLEVPVVDGRMLRLLAEAANAKSVVEIGTSTGYSGLWFCLALENTGGHLTTFEYDATRASRARRNFEQAGMAQRVTIIEGDAHANIGQLKGPVDVVFIDADKEGYIDYLKKLLPLVRPGGILLAHNSGMVADYLRAVNSNPELDTVVFTQGGGLTITVKKH